MNERQAQRMFDRIRADLSANAPDGEDGWSPADVDRLHAVLEALHPYVEEHDVVYRIGIVWHFPNKYPRVSIRFRHEPGALVVHCTRAWSLTLERCWFDLSVASNRDRGVLDTLGFLAGVLSAYDAR